MRKGFIPYLDSLKFDPRLWSSWHAKYITNFRLVLLLIITITAIGIFQYFDIPRRLNPEIKIPIIAVVTALPGANPTDIESLVTIPLEDKLNGMKDLDTMTSASQENISSITLQFRSGVDREKARDDVQSIVDTVTLPTDAKTPSVVAFDFENQPIWIFALTSQNDTASLMRFAKILEDRVKDAPAVDRVTVSGANTQEVQIIINPTKVREYGINPLTLSQTISRATNSYPAGSIYTNSSVISLSIDPEVTTVTDLRNIRIITHNQIVSLSDIATIQERTKLQSTDVYFASPNQPVTKAVEFFVYKTSAADIDAAEREVRKIVTDTLKEYENKFQIQTVMNTAEDITRQFDDLIKEFRTTIILVFVNLFIFLGLRQAIISSLTFPLTFLASIAVLHMIGQSLNFLTLFAFLLALGLLIDDTIVTVTAMTRYYATGRFTPEQTGLLVWHDFIVPLWSTTITTIWAFVPLLLSSGIIGEFIKPIPIVVTTTMLSSTSIAVLITLPLIIVIFKAHIPYRVKVLLQTMVFGGITGAVLFFLPKTLVFPATAIVFVLFLLITLRARKTLINKTVSPALAKLPLDTIGQRSKRIVTHGFINTEILSQKYMRLIDRILESPSARRKTIFIIVVFAVVAYLLVPLGLVQNEFFPKTDEDRLYVSVEMPLGMNLDASRPEALRLMQNLRKTEEARYVILETGTTLGENFNRAGNQNSFLYTLYLHEDRKISSIDLAEKLRAAYEGYTRGTLAVREESGGPPAGADLQIKLLGNDLTILDGYANEIILFLEKQEGITNPEKSIKPGTSKLVFVPDKVKLAENGVGLDAIGVWLRSFASGFTLDTLKIDETETDIVFRMDQSVMTPEQLGSLTVSTQGGAMPLLSLGEFHLEPNPTLITREEGKRVISVVAGVTKGYNVPEKNKDLETFANTLNFPSGYSWQTGGANEENNKSVQSIFQAMGLSFLLILATMVIEFGSYRQALLTLLVIPLAIPGVFYLFALTGTPLSFPALIGVLALFGIVITNAIVVVEKINDNRKHGMNLHDSVVDAAGSRLEPVLLTSITTILGLIPITLSNPLWRGLGGAIISGLFFSGVIKLFFVPIVYYMWYLRDEKKR